MKARIYSQIDKKIINEWQLFWENSSDANYTNSPQWFVSVIEAFKYIDYAIVALYQNENLKAIGGFVKNKKYGANFYTIAPGNFICGLPFLLDISDKILLQAFIKQFSVLGTVYLENIPQKFVALLQEYYPFTNAVYQTVNLYFPIIKDKKGIVLISKRRRLTNRIREIEDEFQMRFFDGNSSEGLKIVFRIDSKSTKRERGYSTFTNSTIKIFYQALANHLQDSFWIHVLYFKGIPIAYYIGFVVGETYYWSQNAYITEYGQYSPGKILLVKLLDDCGVKQISEVNFGSGDSRMKRLLTEKYTSLFYVVISKSTMKRYYLQFLTEVKNNLYKQLQSHSGFYTIYRRVKRLFIS
ncbi:MAG TPA: GNAT family N-acetyltransferase [Candidatus Sulfotelmatobacter sp.]|jgi:hypothetical protein|nr:GNAT family N-acetyltransferase [Candidatus Sulfotelmatobacter sp.]